MTKRRLGFSATLLLVIIGTTIFVIWSRGPSASKIVVSEKPVKGAQTADFTTQAYINDHLSTQIPKRYLIKTTNIGEGKPLYIQQLLATQPTSSTGLSSDQLAITVGKLPVGGLNEVSDVTLRQRTSDYTAPQLSWLGTNAVVYQKDTNNYELGMFVADQNRYATIVATVSSDKKAQSMRELQTIYQTLIWR